MKKIILLLIIVLSCYTLDAVTITTLKEPVDPSQLIVDSKYIYITDFPYVYIYSSADFTLKATLGGEGDGPEQFKYQRGSLVNKSDNFRVNVQSDRILVSSQGKVSFYNKNGTFLNVIKTQHRHDHKFFHFKGKYIGLTQKREADNVFYIKLNVYNARLQKEKEVFRFRRFSQPPMGDINVIYDKGIIFNIWKNNLFVTAVGNSNSPIDVYDLEGNKKYSIFPQYNKTVVSEKDKNRYLNYYKAGPLKYMWDRFKKRIKFPVDFPGLREFCINNGKIYIMTFKKTKDKSEILVLDIKGKLLKRLNIPLIEQDIYFYPYSFYNGSVYQLVENENDENWILTKNPTSE